MKVRNNQDTLVVQKIFSLTRREYNVSQLRFPLDAFQVVNQLTDILLYQEIP